MPISSLPVEILDLIFSHVARPLLESERLEECGRLALVCKQWVRPAQAAAWSSLNVSPADKALIDHLLAHPLLTDHVRRIVFNLGWRNDDGAAEERQRLLRLLKQCRPSSAGLSVGSAVSPFFRQCMQALGTSRLRTFMCIGDLDDAETVEDVVAGLRNLPALQALQLLLAVQAQQAAIHLVPEPDNCIKVRHFSLMFDDDGPAGAESALLGIFCSILSDDLEIVSLRVRYPSALSLAPLAAFTKLHSLWVDIKTESPEVLYDLCDKAADMCALRVFGFHLNDQVGTILATGDGFPPSVHSEALLRRTPPRLECGIFSGWRVVVRHPGTFVDIDPKSSIAYDGKLPYISIRATPTSGRPLATYYKVVDDGRVRWALPNYKVREGLSLSLRLRLTSRRSFAVCRSQLGTRTTVPCSARLFRRALIVDWSGPPPSSQV